MTVPSARRHTAGGVKEVESGMVQVLAWQTG
jgi:hypothetical protein